MDVKGNILQLSTLKRRHTLVLVLALCGCSESEKKPANNPDTPESSPSVNQLSEVEEQTIIKHIEAFKLDDWKDPLFHGYDQPGDSGRALQELVRMGPCVVPYLMDAYDTGSENVRKGAIATLESLRDKASSALPVLIKAIDDDIEDVRIDAVFAIGHIGSKAESAIPGLLRVMEEGGSIQTAAIMCLGKIGPPARTAVPNLIGKIYSEHNDNAIISATAIEKIGSVDPESLPKIIGGLNHTNSEIRRISVTLLRLAKAIKGETITTVSRLIQDSDESVRSEVLKGMATVEFHTKEAIDALVFVLHNWNRDDGYRFVDNIAGRAAPVVEELTRRLDSPDAGVRLMAVDSLCKLAPASGEILGKLNLMQYRDPDSKVQEGVFHAIDAIESSMGWDAVDSRNAKLSWQQYARETGMTDKAISSLESRRVLLGDGYYRQVFDAYKCGGMPFFITSDSLLNAYHVLYEETILHMENMMADRMPALLKDILNDIDAAAAILEGNPALVLSAKNRAILVTGIALKLMDNSFSFEDQALNKIMEGEFDRIIKAEGILKPVIPMKMTDSFAALDYSRFKPRGFYTKTDLLERYFRARSWLQTIPFRVNIDEELLAMLILGNCINSDKKTDKDSQIDVRQFFRVYESLLGPVDDLDIVTARELLEDVTKIDLEGNGLKQIRTTLSDLYTPSLINDPVSFRRGKQFRIISAHRTPSAVLFQRTTNLVRLLPTGLEVAAALGSRYARDNIIDPGRDHLLKTIDSCQKHFQGQALYHGYLDVLRTLVNAPEPDAPSFIKSREWQAKSCNTLLAGWTQLRHTWVLHAKLSVSYLGASILPAGFVEPDPDFFSAMASFAEKTRCHLKDMGVFDSPSAHSVVARPPERDREIDDYEIEVDLEDLWKRLHTLSASLKTIACKQIEGIDLDEKDNMLIKGYGDAIADIMLYGGNSSTFPRDDAMKVVDVHAAPATGEYFHAAVGRPRIIYVLYPGKEKDILCSGAVMPYYEFKSDTRLNDMEWKARLDSDQCPSQPKWIAPLLNNR